jgi:hypothetical protein
MMKKLISTALFSLGSVFAFSQQYKFDVNSYDFYNISGYAEKDVILEIQKYYLSNLALI